MLLTNLIPNKWNYPVNIAFYVRPKKEQRMLVVMDKSTHEEHLSQPLQTIIKQF